MSANLSGLTRNISNFLFSKANRELLIFLSFMIIAGVFWLMTTLNETYEKDIKFYVQYTNVPKNAFITSGDTDSIQVSISDKGFIILGLLYTQDQNHINIDFNRYSNSDGTGFVTNSDLLRMIESQLPASSKIMNIKTDNLTFYYNYGEKKKVPVKWRGNVTPDSHYFITKTKIDPDSVLVYASRETLDSIKAIYTKELHLTGFHDTQVVSCDLQTMRGVKVIPHRVKVHFLTDVMVEERLDNIPIVGINMPEGKVLRTFPSRVSVRFVTGMKNYSSIKASDFLVVADYEQFNTSPSAKCSIKLQHLPEGVTKATLDINQVDYLIEERIE